MTDNRIARPLLGAFALAVALVAFPPSGAGGQATTSTSPDALVILEAAAERYAGLSGFCAEFRQTVENEILRRTIRSRGELCQARSDRFEMRFSDPEGDRVVADGEHVWIYFPSADPGQVYQGGLGETGSRFDLHGEFLSEPGRRYAPTLEGTEEVAGREAHVLLLEPRLSSPFVRARIWVDTRDHLIRRLEIVEDEGLTRLLELSDLRLDPEIPDARFRFEPPAGVRVVRR